LNYLNNHSYKNLYSVDINKDAISYAKRNNKLNLKHSPIKNYLLKKNYFNVAYANGATIKLIKLTFNIISENGHTLPILDFRDMNLKKNNYNVISIEKLITKKKIAFGL
jgi:hypothetical protein